MTHKKFITFVTENPKMHRFLLLALHSLARAHPEKLGELTYHTKNNSAGVYKARSSDHLKSSYVWYQPAAGIVHHSTSDHTNEYIEIYGPTIRQIRKVAKTLNRITDVHLSLEQKVKY